MEGSGRNGQAGLVGIMEKREQQTTEGLSKAKRDSRADKAEQARIRRGRVEMETVEAWRLSEQRVLGTFQYAQSW